MHIKTNYHFCISINSPQMPTCVLLTCSPCVTPATVGDRPDLLPSHGTTSSPGHKSQSEQVVISHLEHHNQESASETKTDTWSHRPAAAR